MQAQTLSAGVQLAGRYRIEDLVGETARSQTWRAVDRVLNRSVGVQVVRSDDTSAEAFLVAARRATVVEDSRFLRVLDAAQEAGYAYVVREWASGVSLENVLREGPLPAARAVEVMREVSEAVAAAHRADVRHQRLEPARVIVKHNGAVRVLGLATDLALHTPEGSAAGTSATGEQADVTALGRLLYACLVARWPGGRDPDLPAAPTEHGRLLRPRQVRAGVDPGVDAICGRILGNGARPPGRGLRSAQQVARELGSLGLGDDPAAPFAAVDDETIPRGVIPAAGHDPSGPPPAVHVVPPPRTVREAEPPLGPADEGRGSPGGWAPAWLAVTLLVILAVLLASLVLWPGGDPGPASDGAGGRGGARSAILDVAAIDDFDPLGSDGENPETAAYAIDGIDSTAWTTQSYFSELQAQKDGVGLLLDLGRPRSVDSVELGLVGTPTSLQVYAAPQDASGPPASVDGLDLVGEVTDADTEVTLRPDEPVRTRYLVVWLTALPQVDSGTWEGSVAEVVVRG